MSHDSAPSKDALRRHRRACQRGESGYQDPDSGLFVMTSVHLRAQGQCCGSACRHCPWSDAERRRAGRPEDAPAWPYPEDAAFEPDD